MATAGPAFSNAVTTTLSKAFSNLVIHEFRVMREIDAAGAIKPKSDMNALSETLTLNYASNTWETWAGFQSYTATENVETITTTHTEGRYGDTESVRPDKIQKYRNSPDRIYDLIEVALKDLKGRAKEQWNTELFSGDGTALRSGKGTRIIGYNNIVVDAPASATINGISAATYSNYRPQVIDANSGPSADFDADRTWMLGALGTQLRYPSGGKAMAPSFGVCSRALALTFMDEYAGTIMPNAVNSKKVAEFGADTQQFRAPDGTPIYFDDNVPANELQYWNVSEDAFDILIPGTELMEVHERKGHGYYMEPPVFELNVNACVRFKQPRAQGKLINANASGSITTL